MTSARSCNKVGHLFWFTILAQHETNDVILYIHSILKHRGNSFQRQNYKMRLKQRSLNWINSMQVKKILFTNVFFSWSLCLLNNRHHNSWPFLECKPSKLYFKILWKYDDLIILPGKYTQVLSISHKMADYFAFPLLL